MKSKATFQQLPIELLTRGRYQPRKHFDATALEGLAESRVGRLTRFFAQNSCNILIYKDK